MARPKIHEAIPETVREQLIALGILQRRLREIVVAVERRENRIIEELTGVKVDSGLLTDLIQEHNANAAKLAAKADKIRRGGKRSSLSSNGEILERIKELRATTNLGLKEAVDKAEEEVAAKAKACAVLAAKAVRP